MTLVYYKGTDGKILHYHSIPKNMTMEELTARVEEYNDKPGSRAVIHEIKEGSFEMHLWEAAQNRKLYKKTTIDDAKDAIRQALEAIESLEEADV